MSINQSQVANVRELVDAWASAREQSSVKTSTKKSLLVQDPKTDTVKNLALCCLRKTGGEFFLEDKQKVG